MPVDWMSVDKWLWQMSEYKMSVDKMPVDKMSEDNVFRQNADRLNVYRQTVCCQNYYGPTSVDKIIVLNICVQYACRLNICQQNYFNKCL